MPGQPVTTSSGSAITETTEQRIKRENEELANDVQLLLAGQAQKINVRKANSSLSVVRAKAADLAEHDDGQASQSVLSVKPATEVQNTKKPTKPAAVPVSNIPYYIVGGILAAGGVGSLAVAGYFAAAVLIGGSTVASGGLPLAAAILGLGIVVAGGFIGAAILTWYRKKEVNQKHAAEADKLKAQQQELEAKTKKIAAQIPILDVTPVATASTAIQIFDVPEVFYPGSSSTAEKLAADIQIASKKPLTYRGEVREICHALKAALSGVDGLLQSTSKMLEQQDFSSDENLPKRLAVINSFTLIDDHLNNLNTEVTQQRHAVADHYKSSLAMHCNRLEDKDNAVYAELEILAVAQELNKFVDYISAMAAVNGSIDREIRLLCTSQAKTLQDQVAKFISTMADYLDQDAHSTVKLNIQNMRLKNIEVLLRQSVPLVSSYIGQAKSELKVDENDCLHSDISILQGCMKKIETSLKKIKLVIAEKITAELADIAQKLTQEIKKEAIDLHKIKDKGVTAEFTRQFDALRLKFKRVVLLSQKIVNQELSYNEELISPSAKFSCKIEELPALIDEAKQLATLAGPVIESIRCLQNEAIDDFKTEMLRLSRSGNTAALVTQLLNLAAARLAANKDKHQIEKQPVFKLLAGTIALAASLSTDRNHPIYNEIINASSPSLAYQLSIELKDILKIKNWTFFTPPSKFKIDGMEKALQVCAEALISSSFIDDENKAECQEVITFIKDDAVKINNQLSTPQWRGETPSSPRSPGAAGNQAPPPAGGFVPSRRTQSV